MSDTQPSDIQPDMQEQKVTLLNNLRQLAEVMQTEMKRAEGNYNTIKAQIGKIIYDITDKQLEEHSYTIRSVLPTVDNRIKVLNEHDRIFTGIVSTDGIDLEGSKCSITDIAPFMNTYIERDAPIIEAHTNFVCGKALNWGYCALEFANGEKRQGVQITGMIHNHYTSDDQVWKKIVSGEYYGLSIGAHTQAGKIVGLYEISVGDSPASPFAFITSTSNGGGGGIK